MEEKDHKELLDLILSSKSKIMVSGYASELYDTKLAEWNRIELKNQAESGRVVTEVIWMNYSFPEKTYIQQTLF